MNRQQFAKKFPGVYLKLLKKNPDLLNKHFPRKRNIITEFDIIKTAKYYTSRGDFQKNSQSFYRAAKRLNLLDKLFPNMKKKWSIHNIKTEALKYNNRKEWKKNEKSSYQSASFLGILQECCLHMEPSKTKKRSIINLDTKQIFKSISHAAKSYKTTDSNIHNALKKKAKAKECFWAYCDEKGNIVK